MLRKTAAVFLSLSFLFGCGQNPSELLKMFAKSKEPDKVRIGVSFPTKNETRWNKDHEYLKQAAQEAGAEFFSEVSDKNAAEQAVQCDEILKKGIDVLILAPHDAMAAGSIAEKAKAAGVKVISYDRLVLGADVDFYVSFDNEKVGELQAEFLIKKAPAGNYVVLSGAPTDNNSKLLRSGAIKVLEPFVASGQIRIIADLPIDNWDAAEAEKIIENIVSKHGTDIAAVIAPNDRTAGGVIKALKRHHIAGLVAVSGQDADVEAASRIVAGLQSMTVFKNSQNLAGAAIGAAMNMAMGQPPPANNSVYNGKSQIPSLLLEPVSVDMENISQTLLKTGYISLEQARKLEKTESIVFAEIDESLLMPAPTGGH